MSCSEKILFIPCTEDFISGSKILDVKFVSQKLQVSLEAVQAKALETTIQSQHFI